MPIERDKELLIWSRDETTALRFLGFPKGTPIRIIKESPETPEEKEKHPAGAKLFAICKR